MIKLKNIFRAHSLFSVLNRPRYGFSSANTSAPQPTPPPEEKGLSIKDLIQNAKKFSNNSYEKAKRIKWYEWAALGTLGAALYYTYQPEQQMYPINNFEEQVLSNQKDQTNFSPSQKGFSEIKIISYVEPQKVRYKIKFIRNNRQYTVDYNEQPERFKQIERVLVENTNILNLKQQFKKNLQVSTQNAYIILKIISAVFICAYFLRSQKIQSLKKNTNKSSQSMTDMVSKKKNFQIITQTKVRFQDVAGLDESKVEVQQFVDFLKNPQKYKKLGARIPKGVLLSGPPGTGKTMLAKACAGEAGVPFIPVSGSDFVQIFVGVGASRVRDLFAMAKEHSPSIIFIDQIDAVGRKRSGGHQSHDERDNTLNQILVEMDGFETDKNVIVMAATNRQNLLDQALIRPGRFDRLVQINLPDLEGRRQIFNVHLTKIKMDSSRTKEEYARRLATLTPGFSGAQIANLCNESAILAARNGKDQVNSHDLQMATERIIGGVERKSLITKQQKKVVAVHESGHAVVSWFLPGADPLLKLTIIPRSKGSLGFAQYFVNETQLQTRSQIIDRICFIFGGRCAEEKFFGRVTNGASDDLKKAYELAHSYVVKLGMSDELGLVAYKDPEFLRPYSEQMGQKIDDEIKKILEECTQKTRNIVNEHQHHIKALSEQLFDKETLTIKQIRRILGERDFTNNQTYEKYLQIEKQQEVKV